MGVRKAASHERHSRPRTRNRPRPGRAGPSSRFGTARLSFGHGTTNAFDEAAYLLLHALHLPLDRLDPFLDARLTHGERTDLANLFSRRIDERVPAAYLTHEAWLGEFRFYVDERVIVPRSFIAELLPERPRALRRTGGTARASPARSTCVPDRAAQAILLAHAYPEADVDAQGGHLFGGAGGCAA